MTVKLRLDGEPDEIDRVIAALAAVLEVAEPSRTYPNRNAFGVRVYTEVRSPVAAEPVTATATRTDQPGTHRPALSGGLGHAVEGRR
jgi:hypothetical protein